MTFVRGSREMSRSGVSKYHELILLFFMETIKGNWPHQRHNWNPHLEVESPELQRASLALQTPGVAVPRVVNLEDVNKGTLLGSSCFR